jgi:hypothetical protein
MARDARRRVRDGLEGRKGTGGRGYWAATGMLSGYGDAERLPGGGGTRCDAAEELGDADPGLGRTVADAVTSRSSGLAVGESCVN